MKPKSISIADIRRILFFLMVVTLPFSTLPDWAVFSIPLFTMGDMANKLTVYPFAAGLLLEAYCFIQKRRMGEPLRLDQWSKLFFSVIGLYILAGLISTIWGAFHYPFYDDVISKSMDLFAKVPKVSLWLTGHGIPVSIEKLLPYWVAARYAKAFFADVLVTFGFAFLVWRWCRRDLVGYFNILCNGVLVTLVIILAYCAIEVPSLLNNETCTNILKTVNPYIHNVADGSDLKPWWPPLLWPGQVRSVFAEPSYFGIYFAFAFPFMLLLCTKARGIRSIIYYGIIFLYVCCMFLTNARTPVVLFGGEILLLAIYVAFIHKRKMFLHLGIVLGICILAFFTVVNGIEPCMQNSSVATAQKHEPKEYEKYLDNTIGSLDSVQKRSNYSRFAGTKIEFDIGREHPLVGVGVGLHSGYANQKLNELPFLNGEQKLWANTIEKLGPMKATVTRMNEYTFRFAQQGIIGIILFLVFPVILAFKLLSILSHKNLNNHAAFTIFLSYAGVSIGGFSGNFEFMIWCFWLLLGIGYAWVELGKH